MRKQQKLLELPTIEELEAEITRKKHAQNRHHLVRKLLYAVLILIAAAAVAFFVFCRVVIVVGDSMSPALSDGDLAAVLKTDEAKPGELVAFSYRGKLFVKRIAALGGSVVDVDEAGKVSVDGVLLEEPYLTEKAFTAGDVEFPFTVPEGQYFVLSDDRSSAADSRSSVPGCVAREDLLGRVVFRLWPLSGFGGVD